MAAGSPASPAASAARGPAPGVPLVAGARLPLAFIALGLGALAVAAGWLLARPHLLLLPQVHPAVLALAHLWLPGFLLSASVGAVYQLMPVVLGTPLRLPAAAAWTHFALQAAGVPLLVGGFAAGRFEIVAAGGGLVGAGIGVLTAGTWRTFLASARRDAIAWSFPLAVSWLGAAVVFGLVLALNRRWAFLPWSVLDLLRAHAHVGLGGFFLTLLQGATFQLVPMFTLADLRGARRVGIALALTQAGLLVLVPGLALGARGVALAGAAGVVAGIAVTATALGATLRSRRRRQLDVGLKAFVLGAGVLVATAVAGLALLAGGSLVESGGPVMAYGVAAIGVALSLMVMGMLCKIVPFLVWMRTYGPRAGRQPVPQAGALGSLAWERLWLWLHGGAGTVLVAGVGRAGAEATRWGAGLLALGAVFFLGNMLRVLLHVVRPQLGAPTPPLRTAATSL